MSRLGIRLVTIGRALASLASRRRAPAAHVARILIAHDLLLGDTILLAPLLKNLARRHPDAERVLLVRPAFAALFSGRPYGISVLPFDRRDARSQRRVIASGPYDLAIVPDDNRYAWLARAAGARRVVGFAADRPAWKNLMLDRAVPYPDAADAAGAWADLVARLLCDAGIEDDPAPFATGEWPAPAHGTFERPQRAYVVLHVGASTLLKQWPAARWRAVADDCASRGLLVVWSGGAGERGALAATTLQPDEIDLIGRLDLAQLWALLAGAERLYCPDTGVAHLGRVVGVTTIALFGPGSTVVHGAGRFWAASPFRTVTHEAMPCRDQRTLYRRQVSWVRRCGRRYDAAAAPAGASDPDACGRALCMEAIDAATVMAAGAGR